MSILDTLAGLLNSRRQARDLMAELSARGLKIVEDDRKPAKEDAGWIPVASAQDAVRRNYPEGQNAKG